MEDKNTENISGGIYRTDLRKQAIAERILLTYIIWTADTGTSF